MTDIFVLSYPKAGGTWLCRLLGDILNSPVGCAYRPSTLQEVATEGQHRLGDYYIGHGHMMPSNGDILVFDLKTINLNCLKDEKIIVMFRDPRDVVVSANHHWGINSIHKTIRLMTEGRWPIPHGGGLEKFYKAWLDEVGKNEVRAARYELLSDNPVTYIRDNILLGFGPTYSIKKVVDRQSFNNRYKWTEKHGDTLNYGKEYQLRFLRKGVVGDWKNHFDQKAVDMCERYWGDLMREMGYL